jgi:hypothetical protein
MEGILRNIHSAIAAIQKFSIYRHLQTDERSVGTAHTRAVARPYSSLKSRMLGGQAETIMRQGDRRR